LSTIVEIGKGQDGELAIGKEIHNSGKTLKIPPNIKIIQG